MAAVEDVLGVYAPLRPGLPRGGHEREAKQCPGRRIPELEVVLNEELAAWTRATTADERQVDWRFTTSNARVKLRHLYPALEKRRPDSRSMKSSPDR